MATNMARTWCVLRSSKSMVRLSLPLTRWIAQPRVSCICTGASAIPESKDSQSMKRKEFRRVKATTYKNNRHNPEMERSARKGTLHIPLETVRQEWTAKNAFTTTLQLARHYGIFEHILDGKEFTPSVGLTITFGDSAQVHNGNFLTPTQASCQPNVEFECPEDSYWMLVFTNPDGNLIERNKEFLHWMIGNIPGSKISDGEVLCEFLPPVPVQGTGFHRFIFFLLKQIDKLDWSDYACRQTRDIAIRTFSLAELLSNYNEKLIPAGLCFFQATWDESVTQTFMETLGMTEPMYKAKEFVTPTRARKIAVKNVFENKYRNM